MATTQICGNQVKDGTINPVDLALGTYTITSSWASYVVNKPTYTYSEVGADQDGAAGVVQSNLGFHAAYGAQEQVHGATTQNNGASIVARGADGAFSAGIITATLFGTSSWATYALSANYATTATSATSAAYATYLNTHADTYFQPALTNTSYNITAAYASMANTAAFASNASTAGSAGSAPLYLPLAGGDLTGRLGLVNITGSGGATFATRLGVGVISPVGELDVQGSMYYRNASYVLGGFVSLTNAASMYLNNAGVSVINIRTSGDTTFSGSGNFGIGTSAPGTKLDIKGLGGLSIDLNTTGRIASGNTGSGGIWVDGGNSQFFGSVDATHLGVYNGRWCIVADDTGKVGIGTIDPQKTLHVQGEISCSNIYGNLIGGGGGGDTSGWTGLNLTNRTESIYTITRSGNTKFRFYGTSVPTSMTLTAIDTPSDGLTVWVFDDSDCRDGWSTTTTGTSGFRTNYPITQGFARQFIYNSGIARWVSLM